MRTVTDVRVEKDESHPGKVMFRNVYERNKEKFPYSRFEVLHRVHRPNPNPNPNPNLNPNPNPKKP